MSSASSLIAGSVHDVDLAGSACAFCSDAGEWWDTPVLETSNFVALASLGALVAGHVLVIPKRHRMNFRELPRQLTHECVGIVGELRDRMRRAFKTDAFTLFEHGAIEPGSAVGCSVDHAHLHLLPVDIQLAKRAAEAHPTLVWQSFCDVAEAIGPAAREPYLLVTDREDRAFVGSGLEIPSQALRRLVRESTASDRSWNWRDDKALDLVRATLDALDTSRSPEHERRVRSDRS